MENTTRKTVTITSVAEPRKSGDLNIYDFMAQDEAGETVKYTAFNEAIHKHLKTGEDIDIEFKVTQKGDYTNRSVSQVYIGGKPLVEKKEQKRFGKSPEEIRSIERQTSLKCATDIAVAKIGKGIEMDTKKLLDIAKQFVAFLTGD